MSNTGKSVVSTFDETKSIVLAEVKNGVRGVFAIGKSLKAARDFQEQDIDMDTGLTPYLSMFEELPFNEKVGAKFIKIFETKWLRKLASNDSTVFNLPFGYNTLFDLTAMKWNEDEELVDTLIEGFTIGKFVVNGKVVQSAKVSLATLKNLYEAMVEAKSKEDANLNSFIDSDNSESESDTNEGDTNEGDAKDQKPEPKNMVTVAKIEVDKSVFEKDLIQLKVLQKTLASLGLAINDTQIVVDTKKIESLTKSATKVYAELQNQSLDEADIDYLTDKLAEVA